MSKLILSFFTIMLIFLGSVNAEENYKCNMKCDNHKKMERKHCDISKKMDKCECKKSKECSCKENCKCETPKKDEKIEKCGCGMSVKSCKEMMPYCKFREARESNEKK